MNIIEMQNLVVTSTWKKGHFKFTGKIKAVTGKSIYKYISFYLLQSNYRLCNESNLTTEMYMVHCSTGV